MMGAPHHELFADPLGLRKGSSSSVQQARAPQSERPALFSTPMEPDTGDLDSPRRMRREEEPEGWLSSLVWYVVGAGKQCASMRDRTCLQGLDTPQRPPQPAEPDRGPAPRDQARPQSDRGRAQDERRAPGLMQDGNDPFWQDGGGGAAPGREQRQLPEHARASRT
eukprot:CAMPEP_0179244750 /NCGR_PEP_ID=MMETSP0797-20121207/18217_1 /TAXON_ID=47934 /ORGANISM="Dinophysis acuminata, Strain DAEP01" /LENGTH=165 /DNA_ID=CAMNT_0020952273 /DNA_START=143 /DNA_END=637 /DNA_ORIENTATION=-